MTPGFGARWAWIYRRYEAQKALGLNGLKLVSDAHVAKVLRHGRVVAQCRVDVEPVELESPTSTGGGQHDADLLGRVREHLAGAADRSNRGVRVPPTRTLQPEDASS